MSLDFKAIVGAQRKFFNTNQTKSVEFCRQQLLKLREVVESNRQNIYDAVWKDLHRNAEATEKVEMYSLLMELDYTLDHLDEWKRTEKLPTHPFGEPSIHNEPLGNVCIISAFNFQIVLALRPAISALAAGNTVLVKTSENAPHTSKLLVDMINSNFPQEYFTVVEGDGPATERLLQERFSHIFYTGSPQIGRLVMTAASKHLTPVILELGRQ
ncbi:Aldehyde dehydrogenase [Aphelenchoides bicaudatus]|nr:Aldehyde dehydrogenase [Aphelenchoides bicaudatus]